MEDLALKKYLLLGSLMAGSLMCMLSGCGRKKYQQARDRLGGQQLSIGEELQWKTVSEGMKPWYYEDFIWEKEVTDKSTGKKYMIRYAEVFQPEEAEKNNGIYYDGRIYVYDEDTYLVGMTHSEIVSESESIEWEDESGGQEQALVIHYVDGGKSAFYLSGLIQADRNMRKNVYNVNR